MYISDFLPLKCKMELYSLQLTAAQHITKERRRFPGTLNTAADASSSQTVGPHVKSKCLRGSEHNTKNDTRCTDAKRLGGFGWASKRVRVGMNGRVAILAPGGGLVHSNGLDTVLMQGFFSSFFFVVC